MITSISFGLLGLSRGRISSQSQLVGSGPVVVERVARGRLPGAASLGSMQVIQTLSIFIVLISLDHLVWRLSIQLHSHFDVHCSSLHAVFWSLLPSFYQSNLQSYLGG